MTSGSKKAFVTATMVLILLAATFLVLGAVVGQIDTTTLPAQLVGVVEAIKAVFIYGPVVVFSAFLFGVFGYLKNVFKEKAKEAPEGVYNMNKTFETIMLFLSAITPIITMLSTPPISTYLPPETGVIITTVFGAIVAVIKIAKSQMKDLAKETNGNG